MLTDAAHFYTNCCVHGSFGHVQNPATVPGQPTRTASPRPVQQGATGPGHPPLRVNHLGTPYSELITSVLVELTDRSQAGTFCFLPVTCPWLFPKVSVTALLSGSQTQGPLSSMASGRWQNCLHLQNLIVKVAEETGRQPLPACQPSPARAHQGSEPGLPSGGGSGQARSPLGAFRACWGCTGLLGNT